MRVDSLALSQSGSRIGATINSALTRSPSHASALSRSEFPSLSRVNLVISPAVSSYRGTLPRSPSPPPGNGSPLFCISRINGAQYHNTHWDPPSGREQFNFRVGPAGHAMTLRLAEGLARYRVFDTPQATMCIPETGTFATLRPRGLVSISA